MPALDCYEEDWHHTGVHPLTERMPTEGASSTQGVPAWRADGRSFDKWVKGLPLPWRKYYSHEGCRVCVAETTVKSIDPNPDPDPDPGPGPGPGPNPNPNPNPHQVESIGSLMRAEEVTTDEKIKWLCAAPAPAPSIA